MAKRKNLRKYHPAVAEWDKWIGLDRLTGEIDWDVARENAAAKPEEMMAALDVAVRHIVEHWYSAGATRPSLEAVCGLCAEASRWRWRPSA
jgi:hypothetical protein